LEDLGKSMRPVTLHRENPKVVFSPEEGRCLDVLAVLLGRSDKAPTQPARNAVWRAELCEAGGRRLVRAVTAYMAYEGGYCERTFLREQTRTTGRVWSHELGEKFALRFNAPSYSLWTLASERFPVIASVHEVKTLQNILPVHEALETRQSGTGDWVFFALAHEHLLAFKMPHKDVNLIRRKLRTGSPLALLMNPDTESTQAEMQNAFKRLINPVNVRLIECIESRVVACWKAAAKNVWASRTNATETMQRWNALATTLRAWLDVSDEGNRLDLTRSLMRFFVIFANEIVTDEPEVVRARLSSAPGLRTLDEREALLRSVASVVNVGRQLVRRRDELALERYGDDRYEEAQIFVRDVDQILTPSRRKILSLARSLEGELG
jgi:hypothetical protein